MNNLQNKYSTVGNYTLIKTLGSGYNSKVKLCKDLTTDQYYAIKLIKHSHPKLSLKNIRAEINILSAIKHANIVNLVEFNEDAEYIKKNGTSYKVVAIVLELIPGGELFEYIVSSGRFSENIARTYFKILLETIEFCHNQGVVHRDLKAENLLLDANFNLKVADFGFSTLLAGKEENGQLFTVLGTESYMAPEIHLQQPYCGPAVDLFACAVILFIMVSGNPPFIKADPKSDGHYKAMATNKTDLFWEAHERNKPKEAGQNFYSSEFKSLINAMFSLDPVVRLTLAEIKAHPWFTKGECADLRQVQDEFNRRKAMVDEKIQKQRLAKKEQKLLTKAQVATVTGELPTVQRPYRGEIELGDSITKKLVGSKIDFNAPRTLRQYEENAGYKATSQVISVLSPEILFKFLYLACQGVLNEFTLCNDRYMIKKGKMLNEEGTCKLNIEILKVDDNTCCIEFQRKEGAPWVFFEAVEAIKKKLPTVEIEEEESDSINLEEKEKIAEQIKQC